METSSPTAQPISEQRVDGDDDAPKPRKRWNPASSGIRRSCDPCGRRKKKCDREQPCRRCRDTGDECTYSKRRWHVSHLQQPRNNNKQHGLLQQQPDPGRVHAAEGLQHSASSAVPGQGGMLSLKRCRLSASPATGLVGMQENGFLSDFFGCVGFLPLTTRSHIRETMVKIMLSPASREWPPALGAGNVEVGQYDGCGTGGVFGTTFGGEELPVGPSTCIFWCAVALGALVKGSPIESVAVYSQRATDALAQSHSEPADAEVVQAWTNLAYLHGFMGDTAKFQEYLTLSETYLTATIEQGSADNLPVGFAEIIQDRDKATSSSNMESFCSEERVLPQVHGFSTEHEVYRYVMQSFRFFQQTLYSKMLSKSQSDHGGGSCGAAEPIGEGHGDQQPHQHDLPQPQQMTDAMASVWIQDNIVRFEPLRELADLPNIRTGVGGMIINGCLGFEAAGDGDSRKTLERFGSCVKVFAKYPGLCRFHWIGAHKAHTMLAGLAALDIPGAREEYEKLRAAYNSSRPHGSPPAPPREEWQGISSFCDDIHCRAMEGLITSGRMKAFSKPRDGTFLNENGGEMGEEVFGLGGQSQNEQPAPCIFPKEAVTSARCPPGSSETGSDLHGTCQGSGGTEHGLESTGMENAPNVSAALLDRHHLEKELEEDDGSDIDVVRSGDGAGCSLASMVAAPREAMPMTPEEFGDGAIGGMEEDAVAAADWLDVTDALLDGVNESGQEF